MNEYEKPSLLPKNFFQGEYWFASVLTCMEKLCFHLNDILLRQAIYLYLRNNSSKLLIMVQKELTWWWIHCKLEYNCLMWSTITPQKGTLFYLERSVWRQFDWKAVQVFLEWPPWQDHGFVSIFYYSNKVDCHNQTSQTEISIKNMWVTHNPYFWLVVSLFKMCVTKARNA